ncbi:hypothetical protein E4T38_06333 [Aureobasidium subglaciale]|nr:hypothetical protein E4T38_06333 [Aureobasidium subglaciale]KAI5219500.1 hypothetical protein E4T40_06415 [Aureobasidium subglaciale]KAI5223170.1 hypothetical protein E4T41_06255 [Aureobasidium subglaciale]KAI5259724.1 hypothetical protein E4T46_06690 [Aureobasidium subglaciale]
MLTTLHVPFQLLADKLSGRTLAQSVPPSLKHLWLNDDSTFLWLNHNFFQSPQEYYVEGTVSVVFDPSWHLIHTDQEMMDVITDFLTHWRSHVPYLQTIKLLLYPVSVPAWGPRDISAIRMALDSAGQESGVDVSYMNARVVVRVITHSLVKIHRTSNSTEYRRVHGLRCITGDKLRLKPLVAILCLSSCRRDYIHQISVVQVPVHIGRGIANTIRAWRVNAHVVFSFSSTPVHVQKIAIANSTIEI